MADFKELSQVYLNIGTKDDKKKKKGDEGSQFVEQRYNAMAIAKKEVRAIWEGTQDLYYSNDWEWIVNGEDFERPVRFPTLRDTIKSLVDNFMKDPPEVLLKPRKDEEEQLIIGKKAYIDHIRGTIHEKRVRRQVFEDMFFFGKGFCSVNYYDIDKEYNGEAEDIFEDVASRRLDPRDCFVDENANFLHDDLRIDGARDFIYRNFFPLSTFYQLCELNGWDATGTIAESFFMAKGLDYKVSNTRETLEKGPVMGVRVYEYMNQQEDLYIVIANNKCIYEGKLSECKGTKRLPIVDYTFEPRNDSYWGNTLPALLAPHIYMKDTIYNLELMNLKLTLQPVIAVSGEFGFNRKLHLIQPGAVWQPGGPLNGKIGDNVQPLVFGNPNTKSYDMLQYINSEMTVSARTDLRSLEYVPNKTATEILRGNQSMNSHNETIENIAEVESEAVKVKIMLELMKSFMTSEDEDGTKHRVPIEGYVSTKNETSTPEFISKSGYKDFFNLTQEMIDVDCEVEVIDKRSQVALNAEKMGRIMQAYPMIFNIAQLFPEVQQKLDGIGMIEQLVEALGMDLDRSFKEDRGEYDDEFEAVREEIILGNNVDIPTDEDRKESMSRLKYLLAMKKEVDDMKKKSVQLAWAYHLDQTVQNITRNHSKDAEMEGKMQQQQLQAQQNPQQGQGQVNPISQPEPQTMNPAVAGTGQVAAKAGPMAQQLQ